MAVLPEAAAAPAGSSSLALRLHSPDVRMASPSLDARSRAWRLSLPMFVRRQSQHAPHPQPPRTITSPMKSCLIRFLIGETCYHSGPHRLVSQLRAQPCRNMVLPRVLWRRLVMKPRQRRMQQTLPAASQPASGAGSGGALQELIDEVRLEGPSGGEDGLAENDATASPSPTGLTDDSDDDDEPIRPRRSRLRRGDEDSSWRPELPRPPEKHPVTNHPNHYKPDEAWDYRATAPITRLLDARGDPPHRCYLVQWKGRPLQMSWVWLEHVDNATTRYLMQQVDQWQAGGITGPYFPFQRDTASESGKCFMDAFRAALYYLVSLDLVTLKMWDAFEATQPDDILGGVTRSDVTAFFKVLQRDSVPLD
ncbi:hypothetical protein PC115_g2812 [Phytophthora cactorum]|uniref:Chromo domain-containing protein n=1 Tax=Phytophthora cactorum TaxID=29920 RepID=A0A8T1DJY6_9STRA|nr:hypothetical protein PC115_g2812 [Phytophthora cactorum]